MIEYIILSAVWGGSKLSDVLELVGIPKLTSTTEFGGKYVEFVSIDRCKVTATSCNRNSEISDSLCFLFHPWTYLCCFGKSKKSIGGKWRSIQGINYPQSSYKSWSRCSTCLWDERRSKWLSPSSSCFAFCPFHCFISWLSLLSLSNNKKKKCAIIHFMNMSPFNWAIYFSSQFFFSIFLSALICNLQGYFLFLHFVFFI